MSPIVLPWPDAEMKRMVLIMTALLLGAGLSIWGHLALRPVNTPSLPEHPKHIISLAPSITETLYVLGLGQHIAGVTQYCLWPPQARYKTRVAGFSDIHYEAVLRAHPDLAILPIDRGQSKEELARLSLPTLVMDTLTLDGLIDGIKQLGRNLDREKEADQLLTRMRKCMDWAAKRARGRKRPRVLFSVMHTYQGLGFITEINAVGKDGFYHRLIELAGGENIYQGELAFPRLSREAIIHLNPEVIIDVIPAVQDLEAARRDWQSLNDLQAIKDGRLYFFPEEDTIPGPRFTKTLTRLSLALHLEESGRSDLAIPQKQNSPGSKSCLN